MNTTATATDSLAHKTAQYRDLYFALKDAKNGAIDEIRLIRDPLRTLAYGTDASFYRLIPQLVVRVDNEDRKSTRLNSSHPSRSRMPSSA